MVLAAAVSSGCSDETQTIGYERPPDRTPPPPTPPPPPKHSLKAETHAFPRGSLSWRRGPKHRCLPGRAWDVVCPSASHQADGRFAIPQPSPRSSPHGSREEVPRMVPLFVGTHFVEVLKENQLGFPKKRHTRLAGLRK